jgi:membrane protease YdiL (CAAX protease family)
MDMKTKIESNRVWLYLLFAFGIAWAIDLVIFMTGGLMNPKNVSMARALLVLSMAAPALANILTRRITGEGWKDLFLQPRFKQSKRYWMLAWLGTPLLVLLGMAIYYILLPKYFDPTLSAESKLLAQLTQRTGKVLPITPMMLFVIQITQAILIAPFINGLAAFGEEFGWRAYLLPKLTPLGGHKAMLVMGLIWGMWHWPVIFMGYEFGLSYPGYPWLGPIVMLWFTFVAGTFLGWLTLKTKSVWPAALAHGSINSISVIAFYLAKGQPNPVVGPAGVGLLASLPLTLLAFWLLWRSDAFSQVGGKNNQPKVVPAHG